MAILKLKRMPDGSYKLRAQRKVGKELVARAVEVGVKGENLHATVVGMMTKVQPPRKTEGNV